MAKEKPLVVNEDVALVDPSDLNPTQVSKNATTKLH